MNTATKKVIVSVEIEYTTIETNQSYEGKEKIDEDLAICLAINPNFEYTDMGVRLNAIKVNTPDRELCANYQNQELE